ncbi:hypothetical protein F5Y00DRAFT_234727 [Daldinia vernicosa]|uniref:uncharacterized protein n=1 Tax=Daldinia vernicosa TaxID=114800 RepID=UPI002008C36C|nr:uncharacterized protein F5Y00DRAFT_234727 [Daldinia vernicosa]KAI0849756.1 hypothetical protein F5Y00DRAFT_234727 [Daldinia vernicosa]
MVNTLILSILSRLSLSILWMLSTHTNTIPMFYFALPIPYVFSREYWKMTAGLCLRGVCEEVTCQLGTTMYTQ